MTKKTTQHLLTCEQARSQAISILAATRNGDDPAAKRDADRQAITVKELAERFEKEHIDLRLKPSTAKGTVTVTLAWYGRSV